LGSGSIVNSEKYVNGAKANRQLVQENLYFSIQTGKFTNCLGRNNSQQRAQHRLHRTKAGWFSAFDGIHTTGFFGLLAISRQIPLLPVKPAVSLLSA
jgi:hypothetical protein